MNSSSPVRRLSCGDCELKLVIQNVMGTVTTVCFLLSLSPFCGVDKLLPASMHTTLFIHSGDELGALGADAFTLLVWKDLVGKTNLGLPACLPACSKA